MLVWVSQDEVGYTLRTTFTSVSVTYKAKGQLNTQSGSISSISSLWNLNCRSNHHCLKSSFNWDGILEDQAQQLKGTRKTFTH